MSAISIKNAIKANLDALVTAEVLGGATITDLRKDPLGGDFAGFPHAFLMPPAIESEVLDNVNITRTYTYAIMLVWKAENLTTDTDVEEDIEAVLSQFDNDPTLSGTAMAGVLPVSSAPQPMQHANRDLIVAFMEIQAKQIALLTYT